MCVTEHRTEPRVVLAETFLDPLRRAVVGVRKQLGMPIPIHEGARNLRADQDIQSCAISKDGHAETDPSPAANWNRPLGTELVVRHHSKKYEFAACLGPGGRLSLVGTTCPLENGHAGSANCCQAKLRPEHTTRGYESLNGVVCQGKVL